MSCWQPRPMAIAHKSCPASCHSLFCSVFLAVVVAFSLFASLCYACTQNERMTQSLCVCVTNFLLCVQVQVYAAFRLHSKRFLFVGLSVHWTHERTLLVSILHAAAFGPLNARQQQKLQLHSTSLQRQLEPRPSLAFGPTTHLACATRAIWFLLPVCRSCL